MRRFRNAGGLGVGTLALTPALFIAGLTFSSQVGCSSTSNTTELKPEGPPEILQLFLAERITEGAAARVLTQMAFGSHPELDEDDDGTVLSAVARGSQRVRIVFDELLVGNDIEEVACADGSFSRIPRGTTPDDISDCGGPELSRCTKVCQSDAGPVGILDADEDGAADDLRMIDGVVTITCDGVEMPWDPQQSSYQPSGNQQITAGPLGINSLGPAIVIVPTQGFRTGAQCSVDIDASVVDKDDIRPCAASGANCAPGDFSAISWTVEGLRVTGNDPTNGQMNVAPTVGNTGNASVLVQFNAAIDPASLAAITLADETAAFADCATPAVAPCVNKTVGANDPTLVTISVVGGYTPLNMHTVTVGTGLADIFGGTLPAESIITFTTRDNTPVPDAAPTPDAGAVDADVPDAT